MTTTVLHHDDAVGHRHRLDLVVRHVDGGRAQALVQRGHGAGVERGDGLRDHVLNRVLRQLDLDAGALLELLDRIEQRVVLGLLEALDPPHRELFLRQCVAGESEQACGYDGAGPLLGVCMSRLLDWLCMTILRSLRRRRKWPSTRMRDGRATR